MFQTELILLYSFQYQIHLRQFLGTRYSAMDPKFMTEEDMVACGLLPSLATASCSAAFASEEEEMVSLDMGSNVTS